jgi:hypothetical protein
MEAAMARFVSDLVRPRPATVTVFFDGADARTADLARRLRALAPAKAPLLWRDLNDFPAALTLWGIGSGAWRRHLYAVDRRGVLRKGPRALAAVARAIPALPRALGRLPMPAAAFAALLRRWQTPAAALAPPASAKEARP